MRESNSEEEKTEKMADPAQKPTSEPVTTGDVDYSSVMNRYGFPRAKPLFPAFVMGAALFNPWNDLRGNGRFQGPGACCCFDFPTGPNVPAHWWDAGDGWATDHFTDVHPYDRDTKNNGRFRCVAPNSHNQPCNFEIQNTGNCDNSCCWCPHTSAPNFMKEHLLQTHGMVEPPKRQWATGLCDTEGCCEVIFCAPCVGSRQIMAGYGYRDTFSWVWCLLLCFAGCRTSENAEGKRQVTWTPPHLIAAMLTRGHIAALNDVDEGQCMGCLKAMCCSCCSLAQTYREYTAAGVWPGGSCCNTEPLPIVMDAPPQTITMGQPVQQAPLVCAQQQQQMQQAEYNDPKNV